MDAAGYELPVTNKTDFIYMGVGIVIGLLVGLIVVNVAGVPLTLGSGGGCLLAGLVFGRCFPGRDRDGRRRPGSRSPAHLRRRGRE